MSPAGLAQGPEMWGQWRVPASGALGWWHPHAQHSAGNNDKDVGGRENWLHPGEQAAWLLVPAPLCDLGS